MNKLYLLCLLPALAGLIPNLHGSGYVTAIAGGAQQSLFLKSDGAVWGIGGNFAGQLGDGTNRVKYVAVHVMDNVSAISAGQSHSLFLKTDGTAWATGWNGLGQLGDGTTSNKHTPVQVMDNVAAISAGRQHSLFLKTDGTVWTTGDNEYGQLGDGTRARLGESTPVKALIDNVAAISGGWNHSLFLKTDGTVWAAGDNQSGQLGIGPSDNPNELVPVQVLIDSVVAISAKGSHSLFLKTDGTVWATGGNGYGPLGDGTTEDKYSPVQVMDNVVAIATGGGHSLFLKSNGTVWATGYNEDGQLGDGTWENKLTPVQVMENVAAIFSGTGHSLFLKTNGSVWATGYNEMGGVGDGTAKDKSTPVPVNLPDDFEEGHALHPALGWVYQYSPGWASSLIMNVIYLNEYPWIYHPHFGYIYLLGNDISRGLWIYLHQQGKWAWLVDSNGGWFIYADGTFNNFFQPVS
ncbi:MAG: RCC1 domain-containing protein [Puniceicoccaceae bacterium]